MPEENNTKDRRRAIPELSVDVQVLEKHLRMMAIGGVIEYCTLTAAIGRDVQHAARHVLASATKRLLRNEGMVFAAVTTVGIKRLDDIGIVSIGRDSRSRIHRLARRTMRKLAQVQDFNGLPSDLKVEHNFAVSAMGMMAHITSDKTEKKLLPVIQEKLPLAKMLEAVMSNL